MSKTKTILVPLDGSPASEGILGTLSLLARSIDFHAVLLHVGSLRPSAQRFGKAYLSGALREARRRVPTAEASLKPGGVVDAILREARARDVDLVAMTTHGRTGLFARLLGGTGVTLLKRTTAPLLLVRSRATPLRIRKILARFGAHPGAGVLPEAVAWAEDLDAQLLLVSVVSTGDVAPRQERLQRTCGLLQRKRLLVRSRVHAGRPADELVDAISAERPDLVIVESDLDGVAEAVLQRTDATMLVIPRRNRY